MNRRSFLLGVGSLLAAPAIVRIDNIMPVRSLIDFNTDNLLVHCTERLVYVWVDARCFRDLLFPGLQQIAFSYKELPPVWSDYFNERTRSQSDTGFAPQEAGSEYQPASIGGTA